MSKEIEVEKTVAYLDNEKVWSIALWTPKPYGKFYPKTIYVSAIFHKNLDKALKMAWGEFYRSKKFQDDNDKFYENKQTTIVTVAI
jgi:hypothetical protein